MAQERNEGELGCNDCGKVLEKMRLESKSKVNRKNGQKYYSAILPL